MMLIIEFNLIPDFLCDSLLVSFRICRHFTSPCVYTFILKEEPQGFQKFLRTCTHSSCLPKQMPRQRPYSAQFF